MNHHVGREFTIHISPELDALLAKARDELLIRTGEVPCMHSTIGLLLERACSSVLVGREHDTRPVGAMTVAELAELMGMIDVESARRNAKQVRSEQETLIAKTAEAFAHVEGLRAAQVHTIRTTEDLAKWNAAVAHALTHEGIYVAAIVASVDARVDARKYREVVLPASTPPPGGGN